jgi:hypothetical protein
VAKKSTGPIDDDGSLFDYYKERQRRSQERNPTRSAGDDNKADSSKKDKR